VVTEDDSPAVIPRPEHNISRADISGNSLKVLYRLNKSGYQAYLVGGSVRDLLLGTQPKDFDVATDARPEDVRRLFSNCRLIGRRFRLAHVLFGREVVEVATFRGDHDSAQEADDGSADDSGRLVRDNVYGSMADDARRRDFTVNSLYYSIENFAVYDYAGGVSDLHQRVLRLIGDPGTRYREDPVRMLRTVRFAAKLGFTIDPPAEREMRALTPLLEDIAPARLFDECLKLFMGGAAADTFRGLRRHGLLHPLFPATEEALQADGEDGPHERLLVRAMVNTDQRLADDRPVTPAFLFAALLWPVVRRDAESLQEQGRPAAEALHVASSRAVDDAVQRVAIPKRFRAPMREIWQLQARFDRRRPRQVRQLLGHPRFRAAYDFLLLRAHAGEVTQDLADWWTRIQSAEEAQREKMIAELGGAPRKRKRRRRARQAS